MKDSYSLDRDQAGLEQQYQAHYEAYQRIGRRVGVPLTAVRSDTGMMGGAVAHEFMYLTPAGEDSLVLLCDKCGYAANRDVAEFALQPAAAEPEALAEVHTPGTATIGDLAAYLGIAPRQTAKMVFYAAATGDASRPPTVVAAVVRGDLEVNPIQVQHLAGVGDLRPAHEDEIAATGMVPGLRVAGGHRPGRGDLRGRPPGGGQRQSGDGRQPRRLPPAQRVLRARLPADGGGPGGRRLRRRAVRLLR